MDLYPTATVISNFYENPDKIRALALKQKFSYCHDLKNINYVFPGCRTEELVNIDQKLYENVCKKIVSIFHNTEHDYMRWEISTSFQAVEEKFGQGVIHQDGNTVFAAICYLTPNAPLSGGTSLFIPNASFDKEKYESGLNLNDYNLKNNLPATTEYHSMFDETMRINNVYNTLVIFNAQHYHKANQFFGNGLETCRLTQTFFIKKIDARSYNVFPMQRMHGIKI